MELSFENPITASEARKASEQNIGQTLKQEVDAAFKSIRQAVASNQTSCTHGKLLSEQAQKVLTGAPYSYKITGGYVSDPRDGGFYSYTISW